MGALLKAGMDETDGSWQDTAVPVESPREHRDRVAHEILDTERTYIKQLECASEEFLIPLRAQKILTADEIQALFSSLELIRDFNRTLLKDLECRIENWHAQQCIGDVFLTLAPFLKMYSQYCANFNRATETIIALRQNNREFVRFEQSHPLPLYRIESYLILPVQRIPRYFMLLEDILRHTPPDHPDHSNLQSAVAMTKNIADHVNEHMRTLEHIDRVYRVDLALRGGCKDLVQPHRRWIAEGEMARIRTSLREMISYSMPVRLYLFNDLLVVSEKERKLTGGYNFSFMVPLMEIFALDDEGEAERFKIVSLQGTALFVCKSEQEKWEWLERISRTTSDLIETKSTDSQLEYKMRRESLAASLKVELPSAASLGDLSETTDEGEQRAKLALSHLYTSSSNVSEQVGEPSSEAVGVDTSSSHGEEDPKNRYSSIETSITLRETSQKDSASESDDTSEEEIWLSPRGSVEPPQPSDQMSSEDGAPKSPPPRAANEQTPLVSVRSTPEDVRTCGCTLL